MKARRGMGESGFTLLEVLITLAILAVGVTLTLSLISGALANIRKVQVRARTIQHAETVMELTLLDDSIVRPTTLNGDFADGTRWTVRVSEYEIPKEQMLETQQPVEMPVKLLDYSLEIMSPGASGPDLRLDTLKLVGTQPGDNQEAPK
jgi:prepilin-type N-terminal cleavage/methylation domain-containing protein